MDWIVPPLICAIIFGTIYKVTELFVHRRERMLLISKLSEIRSFEFKGINFYSSGGRFTGLRIGWVLVGVGLGLFFGFCINAWVGKDTYLRNWGDSYQYVERIGSIVYAACACIFGGIGLLISYAVERSAEKEKQEDL